ncbi:MAG: 1-aminocyclopropane-1-carboxylate deaminase/D-cysteine desulfhydrase, partial [Chloroflexota bacterium]
LPRFAAALGGGFELVAKREDLLPLAFSGNKLRNLEFLVGAALAESADTLVTSGRRWSNHCRLTAAAGARAGLGVHVVLSGPPVDASRGPAPGVLLDELLGASVHETATDDRVEREALVERVVADLRADGRRPYVIGVGGGGPLGVLGQALAALELVDQTRASGLPDLVVVPSATGGTQAGLIVGFALADVPVAVRGIAVAHPAAELGLSVDRAITEVATFLGVDRPGDDIVIVDGDHLGDGYGRRSQEAETATRLLARTEGLLVDPIYTAKALAAVVALAARGELDGRRVVFWHAGGLPGLFEPLPAPGSVAA